MNVLSKAATITGGAALGLVLWGICSPRDAKAWWGCMQDNTVLIGTSCGDCPDFEEDGYECGYLDCFDHPKYPGMGSCFCVRGSTCSNWW